MGCDLFKNSVTNPHYNAKPPARLSSKTKTVVSASPTVNEQDQTHAAQAAQQLVE